MSEEEMVQVFKALSAGTRLRILKLIRNRHLCVNAITAQLPVSQPAVSQHLSVLREAGLVRREQYGSIVHYALDRGRLEDFKRTVSRTLNGKSVIWEK
jgi:DNA-binding transcriptional ArsR family regulator